MDALVSRELTRNIITCKLNETRNNEMKNTQNHLQAPEYDPTIEGTGNC